VLGAGKARTGARGGQQVSTHALIQFVTLRAPSAPCPMLVIGSRHLRVLSFLRVSFVCVPEYGVMVRQGSQDWVRACDFLSFAPHYAPPSPRTPLLQGSADEVDRLSTLDALDSTITATQHEGERVAPSSDCILHLQHVFAVRWLWPTFIIGRALVGFRHLWYCNRHPMILLLALRACVEQDCAHLVRGGGGPSYTNITSTRS
jgi:hypothetical protein